MSSSYVFEMRLPLSTDQILGGSVPFDRTAAIAETLNGDEEMFERARDVFGDAVNSGEIRIHEDVPADQLVEAFDAANGEDIAPFISLDGKHARVDIDKDEAYECPSVGWIVCFVVPAYIDCDGIAKVLSDWVLADQRLASLTIAAER